ncbi:MAG: hypothetical protein HY663_04180 [Chloroflexi bacterium]|nr:hypothetical protein [Chloroflexota bacterium]
MAPEKARSRSTGSGNALFRTLRSLAFTKGLSYATITAKLEFKQYWIVIRRRLWLLIALTVIAGVASLLLSTWREPLYTTSTRIVVGMPPESKPLTGDYFSYDSYYSLLSSEYLVDDFVEIIKSRAFADDIKSELGNVPIPLGTIESSRSATRTHRIVTLKIASKDREEAQLIVQAAVKVIDKKGKDYFAPLGGQQPLVRVIDPPSEPHASGRVFIDVGLRTLLGFMVGLGLIFVLHYLDTTIRLGEDAERWLSVRVLGEIPPEG